MKYWSEVITPIGKGYVAGKDSELIQVAFTKKDYVGKDGDISKWLEINKDNGPCCFKWFKKEEINVLS